MRPCCTGQNSISPQNSLPLLEGHFHYLNRYPYSYTRGKTYSSSAYIISIRPTRRDCELFSSAYLASFNPILLISTSLLQKLLEDLRSTLKAEYENIVQKLFKLFARRLSPDALSILLSTLTAVFRHLLFSEPSQAPEGTVIENTWTLLCENVTKCDAETKRAAAEVWSPVLRRLKRDDQTRCVKYMLTFSARSSEIVAWALVASAKVCSSVGLNENKSNLLSIERRSDSPHLCITHYRCLCRLSL